MLNYKIKNSEELILLEDLFEESNIKKSNISYDIENTYFLLNLELPNPKDDIYSEPQYTNTSSPIKFGFLELLEKIHDKDLCTNNPWFNPNVRINKYLKKSYKKHVHFNITEIIPALMPYCRRNGDYTTIVDGKLHANECSNATQEVPDVLGEHVWYNRVFILKSCVQCPTSLSEFYDLSQDYNNKDLNTY